jgi:multiple sugar transport system substrate-binding protein
MTRRLFALLCAALLALTACGGGDDTGGQAAEQGATQGGGEGGEGGEVALRWRTRPDNQAEIDVYNQVSQDIDQRLEGVTLSYEPGTSETSQYQDVLKTELASGTAPDVYWIPGTDIADFVQRDLVLDLRPYAEETEGYSDDAFYPGPMEFLTYDPQTQSSGGPLWGLPRDVSTMVLYLNLDLIREAGAPDPRELAANGEWNWDSFLEVAQAVTQLGPDIKGYGQNNWWGPYGYWINAAGGSFFNEDRTACAVDTEEALQGLDFFASLYNQFDVGVPYGEDAEPPFLAGQVGMFQNGRWATPGTREGADFEWDVVKLPDGPAGPSNWLFWGAYAVNPNTEDPEAAWRLVNELTQVETQRAIAEQGANIPSRVSEEAQEEFLTFTPPENNEAFLQGLEEDPQTEGPLFAGDWVGFDQALSPMVQSVVDGEMTPEEFGATACQDLAQYFEQ